MPSKSKKQHDFMAAVANNPKFAKKAGVPQSVGKDYTEADGMKQGGLARKRRTHKGCGCVMEGRRKQTLHI
jgi:hypothetical protein